MSSNEGLLGLLILTLLLYCCTIEGLSIVGRLISNISSKMASEKRTFHVYPYHHEPTSWFDTNQYSNVKVVHIVRHAQGTHNINRKFRDEINLYARLTDTGVEQCQRLAKRIRDARDSPLTRLRNNTQLIVTSPLARCIQTSLHAFPMLKDTPIVAY